MVYNILHLENVCTHAFVSPVTLDSYVTSLPPCWAALLVRRASTMFHSCSFKTKLKTKTAIAVGEHRVSTEGKGLADKNFKSLNSDQNQISPTMLLTVIFSAVRRNYQPNNFLLESNCFKVIIFGSSQFHIISFWGDFWKPVHLGLLRVQVNKTLILSWKCLQWMHNTEIIHLMLWFALNIIHTLLMMHVV